MSDTIVNQITTLIVKGIAKGATAIAQATVRTIDIDHNALDVAINGALPAGANTIGKVDQGAGGASAWKVDGSAVTQPVSGAVTATQGTAAAVGAPWYVRLSDGASAVAVALDSTVTAMSAKLPASLGIKAAASSLSVTPASDALYDVKDRVGRLVGAITGRDGATIASASNGVPVSPETSSVWDVKDRAARVLGLLIGYDGAAVTSATNALPIYGGILSGHSSATVAATGVQIKATPGVAYSVHYKNDTGNARYLQIHNSSGQPAGGNRAIWSSASLGTGTSATLQIGHAVFGGACGTAVYLVVSTSIYTYTATTDTAMQVELLYK